MFLRHMYACTVRALFVFLCRFSEVDIQLDKRLYDAFHAVCTYTSMVKIAVFTKNSLLKKLPETSRRIWKLLEKIILYMLFDNLANSPRL